MRAAGVEPVQLGAGKWRLRPWADPDVTGPDPTDPDVPDPGADRAALISAFADPAMARFVSWRVRDSAEADVYLRRRVTEWRDGTRCSWAVVDGAGRVAGEVGLKEIDSVAGTARLAVWTHPEFRGRGVAPAAVEAACVFGFDALGLRRLGYTHSTENAASARVAATAGFSLLGPEVPDAAPGHPREDRLLWERSTPAG